MDLTSGALWGALGAIVVVNLLLSGDNAVVIALAARSLPPAQQKRAILWGSVAAIAMRLLLTVFALRLLQVPGLKLAGAAALLWIGARLIVDEKGPRARAQVSLAAAIRTILVADGVMSIDNVIAVAGAAAAAPAEARLALLAIGLGLSIPLIVAGSTLLTKVMTRFPLVITLGAGLLGFIAGQMAVTDPAAAAWFAAHVPRAELIGGAIGAALVLASGTWLRRRKSAAPPTGGA